MLHRFTAVALLTLASPAWSQTVRFVDHNAAGAATGASWTDAFTDLQDALGTAETGDEIWVAEGTYYPSQGSDRDATFQLRSGVALLGGFQGTETDASARDWAAHPTILSGDIGTRGVKTDNSHNVVTGSGTDRTAVLDGFTITAGYATAGFQRNRGGGMRNIAGSPTIRRCVFRANESRNAAPYVAIGGGMFNDQGSSPSLEDVRFEHNRSERQSAGMGNRNASHPMLRRVVFFENEADALGGGLTNETGSAPTLIDVDFIRNRSGGWTGGLDNYQASPRLYNVRFLGNVCAHYGCGMTNDTGGDALVVNAVFVGNRSRDGGEAGAGGLQNNGSSPTLIGVTFVANTAPDGSADGLGHRGSGTVTVRNSVFWGNGDEILDETGASVDLHDVLVKGGYAGDGVLDANPLFVRAPSPGPDAAWGTADDDYGDPRLQPGSPGLDAGDSAHLPADAPDLDGDGDTTEPVSLDLAGDARVMGSAPDLGAYEGAVPVAADPAPITTGLRMDPVAPNPALGPVTVSFALDAPWLVTLRVIDALGREVARLVDARLAAGAHEATWVPGEHAPGLYTLVLAAEGRQSARTVVLR